MDVRRNSMMTACQRVMLLATEVTQAPIGVRELQIIFLGIDATSSPYPIEPPSICATKYKMAICHDISSYIKLANVTAGFRWAPDIQPKH